jgi:hypothetical protein
MAANKYINSSSSFRTWYHGELALTRFLFAFLILLSLSCKKLIEVNGPVTSINGANVYADDATAISVLTGIYTDLSQNSPYGSNGFTTLSAYCGLSSDELSLYGKASSNDIACYTNALSVSNSSTVNFWSKIYRYIYFTNAAIEGLSNSTSLTPVVKQQLMGEAKFMRAFCYFYLINLYGDVPLAISSDYAVNAVLARSSKVEVYQQMISDLKEAKDLLSSNYVDGSIIKSSTKRVRPNKSAAAALLSRTYLFSGDYVNAEEEATVVIDNSVLYSLATLNNVFLNSSEAIWQLQPVYAGWNTEDAKLFNLSSSPLGLNASHPVYLSSFLINAFEAGDNRKTSWTNSYLDITGTYYYPHKYKTATKGAPVTEYLMVLRLAEQYLIRAEARTQQNNFSGAQNDLNMIRTRAGLANTIAKDKASLLVAILHERQMELFTEWGHRWLDIKRTNSVDTVMNGVAPKKNAIFNITRQWNTDQQLYPIPIIELQRDPNLVQNTGY